MKRLLLLLTLIICAFSINAFAQEDPDELGHLAEGSQEYEFIRYTDEYIQLKIQEDMKVACKKKLCTLFAISDSGHQIKTKFAVGESAGNYYGGGGNGGVIILPGDDGGDGGNMGAGPYIGLSVEYSYYSCKQKILVPESIYIAMNTFMYNLVQEDGSASRTFTPADEAMIMFYTTIMKQAKGCKPGN